MRVILTVLAFAFAGTAAGQTPVVVFDEADEGAAFIASSSGFVRAPDSLLLGGASGDLLPLERGRAHSGAVSGRLTYRHADGGAWEAFVYTPDRSSLDATVHESLLFHLNGPAGVLPAALPRIGVVDADGNRSLLQGLGDYLPALDGDPETWQPVAVPLASFTGLGRYDPEAFAGVRFAFGGATDDVVTLWFDAVTLGTAPRPPDGPPVTDVEALVGEHTVNLRWRPPSEPATGGYVVYRSDGDGAFRLRGGGESTVYTDLDVEAGTTYRYVVVPRYADRVGAAVDTLRVTPAPLDDAAFRDLVARTAFDFFWHAGDTTNGLVPDRTRPNAASSVAAVGFGLTAYGVGADRGYISRSAARHRTLRTLRFLWNAPQGTATSGTIGYRGFYYHFLDPATGHRRGTSELSTIDTALLMAGVLYARNYFDGPGDDEAEIRALADSLYNRVDWAWAAVRGDRISHGWRPETGMLAFDYGGYNEAMILYLLALGSPTHPVRAAAWPAFTTSYRWETHYGHSFVVFPPLFGHQYTHVWVDFRGRQDPYMRARGIDYFENSRRATLAQRAYSIAQRTWTNYGADEWGLTASDVPTGYRARGAPPAQNDDGTIAPTAPGGSIAFTPEESLALRRMYDLYHDRLWGPYGFRDAYNVTRDWFATDYLGIDQGPILLMIANLEAESVWAPFMRDPAVQRGLERADFRRQTVGVEDAPAADALTLALAPQPAAGVVTLRIARAASGPATLAVYDLLGRRVLAAEVAPEAVSVDLDLRGLAPGLYYVRLAQSGASAVQPLVVLR